jgi:hypothetical protein
MGDSRGTYGVLLGKPDRKKTLGRPKGKWKVNVKVYL